MRVESYLSQALIPGDILNRSGEISITGSVSGSSFDNWDVLNIMTDDFDMDELKNSNESAEIQ